VAHDVLDPRFIIRHAHEREVYSVYVGLENPLAQRRDGRRAHARSRVPRSVGVRVGRPRQSRPPHRAGTLRCRVCRVGPYPCAGCHDRGLESRAGADLARRTAATPAIPLPRRPSSRILGPSKGGCSPIDVAWLDFAWPTSCRFWGAGRVTSRRFWGLCEAAPPVKQKGALLCSSHGFCDSSFLSP